MEPIKNALAQAGDFVQQAVHAVVEVFQGNDETQGATASSETEQDKNIDSRTKQFEKEQTATLEKSEITKSTGGYQDAAKKVMKTNVFSSTFSLLCRFSLAE